MMACLLLFLAFWLLQYIYSIYGTINGSLHGYIALAAVSAGTGGRWYLFCFPGSAVTCGMLSLFAMYPNIPKFPES